MQGVDFTVIDHADKVAAYCTTKNSLSGKAV